MHLRNDIVSVLSSRRFPFLCRLGVVAGSIFFLALFPLGASEEERMELARTFSNYDFEPRGNHPASQDLNQDGWPDYWEAIRDEAHPHWNANRIRIVKDPARPGLYREQPGHVLQIPFDGTRVAIQTLVPKTIDPAYAYEILFWSRSEGLDQSIVQLTLIWMRIHPREGDREVERYSIPTPRGQKDWPESPIRVRINDIPPSANALRLVCEIFDDPEIPGADRYGMAWFDDIRVESRPKIRITPTFVEALPLTESSARYPPVPLTLEYLGLADPAAEKGAAQQGGYFRTLSITDLEGQPPRSREGKPVPMNFSPSLPLQPGPKGSVRETLSLPFDRLGVYYVTVKLFRPGSECLAHVTQAIGLWFPPKPLGDRDVQGDAANHFGLILGEDGQEFLAKHGLLHDLIRRSGVRNLKIPLWPRETKLANLPGYGEALSRELQAIQRDAIYIIGVISERATPFGGKGMHTLMHFAPDLLTSFCQASLPRLGPFSSVFQWGSEADRSFWEGLDEGKTASIRQWLIERTTTPFHAYPLPLGSGNPVSLSAGIASRVSFTVPEGMDPKRMAICLAHHFPEALRFLRKPDIYPPLWLQDLAPPLQTEEERIAIELEGGPKQEAWVSLELPSLSRFHREAAGELHQAEVMAQKAILARALGFPRIFVGEIGRGPASLLSIDPEGHPLPRPAFLALRVLEEYLGGSEYIGSFLLRNREGNFPNYIFRRKRPDGREEAVVALWYEGEKRQAVIDIGGGGSHLSMVDLEGNVKFLGEAREVFATRLPRLIVGMRPELALTRMSIAIEKDPPLLMRFSDQRQRLRIRNYFDEAIQGEIRLDYAADQRFEFERNWTVRPETLSFNIRRAIQGAIPTETLLYTVRPTENSTVDLQRQYGRKYVLMDVRLHAGEAVNLRILRETDLVSDVDVQVDTLPGPEEHRFVYLRMRVKWIPPPDERRQAEILIMPYYLKYGQFEETLGDKREIAIPPYKPDDTESPPVIITMKIPRDPHPVETWIGFRQVGGDRFYRQNITHLMTPQIPAKP